MKYVLALLVVGVVGAQTGRPPFGAAPVAETRTQGPVTVAGSVEDLTGNPLAGVKISLVGIDATTMSDSRGFFELRNIPQGRRTIRAERNGYVGVPGDEVLAVQYATLNVDVGERLAAKDVHLTLVRSGVLVGRVSDPEGLPIAETPIELLGVAFRDGLRVLALAGKASSDDRGEYRISGMAPGEYYVRATPPDKKRQGRGASEGTVPGPTYFGGVTDAATAKTVVIAGGSESYADIQFTSTIAVTVSGIVVDSIGVARRPGGGRAEPASIRFQQLTTGRLDTERDVIEVFPNEAPMPERQTGHFVVHGVRRGEYEVFVVVQDETGGSHVGRSRVDVGNADVEGVVLVVEDNHELKGKIGGLDGLRGRTLRIQLDPIRSYADRSTLNQTVDAEGGFAYAGVPRGKYRFQVGGLPSGVYISDLRQGARSILETGVVTIGPDQTNQVEIRTKTSKARVAGIVRNVKSEPVADARVVLVPTSDKSAFRYERMLSLAQ